MEVIANGTTLTSPLANASIIYPEAVLAPASGILGRILAQLNVWTVLLTLLIVCATYDQCERLLFLGFRRDRGLTTLGL
jgi:hypothetical protein